ncbi:MAG: hypothetical protein HOK52_02720 [Candidatus Marinimicrobia bacterium]|nr:hypothetical protein [Candidatus Neomarinimicrobiota bacterium]MBT3936556.1 hypothetical protein [Candidatus Neomarinimicrobiota bacterium]MBT3961403.1 hypothetical protein [Candidatus Neomarinimicrobiota bacterium]MBT4382767.1 hypothetical protein [Candidatus Neomarinimicrobiota bacterium]MBT4635525.1 hypothetical protein [Candidatus Neomarinimicrobiota bacterium]
MKKSLIIQAILALLFIFMTGCASKKIYPVIDTKFKLHEYDYAHVKDLAFIKIGTTTQLYCIKHSDWENIKVKKYHHEDTDFTISDPYPNQGTPEQDTFNSQRGN